MSTTCLCRKNGKNHHSVEELKRGTVHKFGEDCWNLSLMGHRDGTHQSRHPEAAVLPSVAFPRRVPLHVVRQQPLPKRPMHGVDADPDVIAIDPGVHMSCRSGWARLGEQFRPRVRAQLRTFLIWEKVRKTPSPGTSAVLSQSAGERATEHELCPGRKS